MPRANEVITMPKRFNNIIAIIWLMLILALQGCTTVPSSDADVQASAVNAPAEAVAEFNRAVEILKSGQRSVALQLFQQMAVRYPQLAGIQVNIGIIHLQDGKTKDAIAALKHAIQINPANATAYHHLGIAYRQAGQFTAAKDAYLQALKIKPDYANAHLNLGILYDLYLQQLAPALQHYKQYQQLASNEDKQVSKWVVDLERRLAAEQAKAKGGS